MALFNVVGWWWIRVPHSEQLKNLCINLDSENFSCPLVSVGDNKHKTKTMKFLEENIGEWFYDMRVGKNFLDRIKKIVTSIIFF